MIKPTLSIASLLVVVLVLATSALAGTYDVYSCGAAPQGGMDDAWKEHGNSATITAIRRCPPKSLQRQMGYYLHDTLAVAVSAKPGDKRSWELEAPLGTEITGISYLPRISRREEDWAALIETGEGKVLDTCIIKVGQGGCGLGNNMYNGEDHTMRFEHRGLAARSIRAVVRCDAEVGFNCLNGIGEPNVEAGVYSSTVTIDDPIFPAVDVVGGELVGSHRWHKGIEGVRVEGSDITGLLAARVYVDGALVKEERRVCDYSRVVPCTNNPFDFAVDTTTIPDGAHGVQVALVDAAGNETRAPEQQISVANRAPQTPVNVVVDGGPVKTQDGFAIHWDLPVHTTPVTGVRWRLTASTGVFTEGVLPGATTTTGIIQLRPIGGEGVYILSLWVQDEAGYESSPTAIELQLQPKLLPPSLPGPYSVIGSVIKVIPQPKSGLAIKPKPKLRGAKNKKQNQLKPPKRALAKARKSPVEKRKSALPQKSAGKQTANLKITGVKHRRGFVRIVGRINRKASGTITIIYRDGNRTYRKTAGIRKGVWATTLRTKTRKRGVVTARYRGNRHCKPGSVRR